MIIKYSNNFSRKLEKLIKKDSLIKKKLDGKLKLFVTNPRHPSLRLHKIETKEDAWSISIDTKLRVLFIYRNYGILMVDIGSHDEVY